MRETSMQSFTAGVLLVLGLGFLMFSIHELSQSRGEDAFTYFAAALCGLSAAAVFFVSGKDD